MSKKSPKITLKEHFVENVADTDFPDTFGDIQDAWSHEKFMKQFRINVVSLEKSDMEVDLVGVSCSIANSIRRTLISEVPSMAFEKVHVHNNTSLVKDEVLAHRIGLIPLKADPTLFDYPSDGVDEASEQNTLVFELKIKCTSNPDASKSSTLPDELYKNHAVYSKHLRWVPLGNQASLYREKDVRPVHGDILIDKLRPGQELDLKLHAVKGIGKDHAKFSPVATAYYRMLPEISLLKEVTGEAAVRLQKSFSPGVIGLKKTDSGEKRAVVIDARYDACSRNVFRHEDLKDAVRISRARNHFIFTVESIGAQSPNVLFLNAVELLQNKCSNYLNEISSKIHVR